MACEYRHCNLIVVKKDMLETYIHCFGTYSLNMYAIHSKVMGHPTISMSIILLDNLTFFVIKNVTVIILVLFSISTTITNWMGGMCVYVYVCLVNS